ncbi:hypothetical protein QBZ16_002985 [Prototheca wickerhamii]|uniref:Uncharacterized protein n=1 Tax=Prototheca wickerhamii TaxID=3111 RepID=A0AAD9IIS7_PROWI|nr:hypothetical protein QBZ16_002985 [Prototheca wickerhamii]
MTARSSFENMGTWQQAADATADFHARAAAVSEARAKIHQGLQELHAELHRQWLEARVKAQRERLALLRAQDLEAYIGLVSQTHCGGRLSKLLGQTDRCFRVLVSRLGARGVLPAADPATDGLEGSAKMWDALAHSVFCLDIEEQPAVLAGGTLWPYQLDGLRWMAGLVQHGLNGILADEMGLGKTVQVMALVAHMLERGGDGALPFLIVVPASLVANWRAELSRWLPTVPVIAYTGPAEERERIYYRQIRKKSLGWKVLVTTYETLMGKQDGPRLSAIHWSHIIIDEGHRLKNAKCKLNTELRAFTAEHRLLLTGTPLQNNILELWSLLNFLLPDLFDSQDTFQEWFGESGQRSQNACDSASPQEQELQTLLTEEEQLVITTRLHQVLRPFVLRRMKESINLAIPEKREVVLECPMSDYQAALTRMLVHGLQTNDGVKGVPVKGVNNVVMELRTISNHPLLSRLHVEGAENRLHVRSGAPPEVALCGKLAVLDRVLARLKRAGHRVLIFSTMTRVLDVLQDHLDWRGYRWCRLDGASSAEDRAAQVAEFNAANSPVFAFLLSVRAGGVGLNLQTADTVIMTKKV